MPFELLPETEGNLVAVRLWGRMTIDDYQSFAGKIDEIVARTDRLRLLGDWRGLDGPADSQAESTRFWMRVEYRHKVERIAIIAGPGQTAEVARLADIVGREKLRHYGPDEKDAALAWLKEA